MKAAGRNKRKGGSKGRKWEGEEGKRTLGRLSLGRLIKCHSREWQISADLPNSKGKFRQSV